jgi:hypothetical protein
VHPAFTPSALAADELDATTVGRTTTFVSLVDRIKGAARDGSRPHTLIVAPRGAGKTHTLHVAVHRSLADPATAKAILPIFIPEDSLAIGSYIDLLVEIARSIDDGLAAAARDMRRHRDTIGIEQAISAAAGGRMILLTIENLDRVFESLGAGGQGALRAWVETSTAIMIFATAPMLFAGVSSRTYPWYGSFIVEALPDLTVDDAVVLLSKAARRTNDEALATFIESTQGRERLRVIHRLAGGSPRLWRIVSEGIDIESLDALVPAVESLLDRLAPYYQQQLWQLPVGEQRLVVELARGWEPRTVTDLATSVGISNQSAAAALGRLASSRWVTSSKSQTGDRRATWYDLTEPLLRYHLQYREDRGAPLRLIVEFLRGFYSRERLLDELADAAPDSPVESHLQRPLSRQGNWFAPGANDIAIVLEAVLMAALDLPSKSTVPHHLERIVGDAIAVQSGSHPLWAKVDASLQNLRLRDWGDDADEALSVFESLCGSGGNGPPPALLLRHMQAWRLRRNGEVDEALRALDDILDATDGVDSVGECDRALIWAEWLEAIPAAKARPRKRAGNGEVGWELAMALRMGDIQPKQFDTVMAAFTEDTQGVVAATVAMATRALGVEMPTEHDPRRYVDETLLAAIDQFLAEQRHHQTQNRTQTQV